MSDGVRKEYALKYQTGYGEIDPARGTIEFDPMAECAIISEEGCADCRSIHIALDTYGGTASPRLQHGHPATTTVRLMNYMAARDAELAAAREDAERYRWLRDMLQSAVGGGVEVNVACLVYEKPKPGEEARVYWYPDTPVGFHESHGSTLDAAIDAARTGGEDSQ